jgi:hypothetical protein
MSFLVALWLTASARAQTPPPTDNDRLFDLAAPRQPPPETQADDQPALLKPKTARQAEPPPAAAPQQPELDPDDFDGLAEAMKDPVQGPKALAILSRAVKEGRGGKDARAALHDGLINLANAEDKVKMKFVQGIDDPMTIIVPLAVSRSPHSFEAHLMAEKLFKMLDRSGTTLSAWLDENDASDLSGMLYLRLNVYDRLHFYLNSHPEEAAPVAGAIFKNVVELQYQAYGIQALTERLTGPQSNAAVRDAFGQGAMEALDTLPKGRSKALALLLSMYGDRFGPLSDDIRAKALDKLPKAPEVSAQESPSYADWPEDAYRFSFHFSHRPTFLGAMAFFKKRGYAVVHTDAEGVALQKQVGETKLQLVWKQYKSDDEGFLADGEIERFEKAVSADLIDPAYQGVFIRAHSELSQARMFSEGSTPGKLFFDGSCRGSTVFANTKAACRSCSLVGNVGGGDTTANDLAGYDILEGAAAHETWEQIRARIEKDLPATWGRFLGPWSPPYPDALKKLKVR